MGGALAAVSEYRAGAGLEWLMGNGPLAGAE